MKGFAKKARVTELNQLLEDRPAPWGTEKLDLLRAAGRGLAEQVIFPVAVPCFDRSARDGFALRCREIVAASRARLLVLQVIGLARPGAHYAGTLRPCQAVAILTGASLPAGADAVVRREDVRDRDGWVYVGEAVPKGLNVIRRGEVIEEGYIVLGAGRMLGGVPLTLSC